MDDHALRLLQHLLRKVPARPEAFRMVKAKDTVNFFFFFSFFRQITWAGQKE